MKTWHLALIGAAVIGACVWWRRTKPQRARELAAPSIGPFPPGLADPRTVALGTTSPDGKWIVSQSRQPGSVPRWEPTGAALGGIFANPGGVM